MRFLAVFRLYRLGDAFHYMSRLVETYPYFKEALVLFTFYPDRCRQMHQRLDMLAHSSSFAVFYSNWKVAREGGWFCSQILTEQSSLFTVLTLLDVSLSWVH